MTQVGAERIAQLARETFGEQIRAAVTRRRTGPNGYAATLVHRTLGRRIAVGHIDDWWFVRAAWLAATSD